ncbi:MAG: type II toxin-antitoxin system PemK/MazF family toxin [Planctomycetota bacterium]
MTNYERGNIILVPFPFSDQTTTKRRPAVVISSDGYNENSPDIIIMAITSRTEQTFNIGECFIENWQNAGLLRPSTMKPVISTIEKSLILKKLGRLSPRDLTSMDKVLKKLINL